MKRGLFGLIPVVLLLSLPSVLAAETFLDLLFGTSDESLLFLKIAYAMLIFIIFVKVSKESVFKTEQANLANMFSLLLAFFALRFTPNSWVQGFGWIIMFIAPFIIFYKLLAVFWKQEKDTFSWLRFLLALFATFLLWFALGSTPAFGAGLGSTPVVGGFFDELFSDAHYFIFGSLSPFFVMLLAGLVIGLVFLALSRLAGGAQGGAAGTGGFGNSFFKGFLLVLAIAGILALIGFLLNGGLTGITLPLEWIGIGIVGLFILGVICAGLYVLYLLFTSQKFRQWISRDLGNLWGNIRGLFGWISRDLRDLWRNRGRLSWLGWILFVFVAIIGLVILFYIFPFLFNPYFLIPLVGVLVVGYFILRYFQNRTPGAATALGNRELYVTIERPGATPRDRAIVIDAGAAVIPVASGSTTPFVLRAYRRRRAFGGNFGRVALDNAQITITFTNGTFTPANGNTNNQGMFPFTYTAPNVAGVSQLNIRVIHPDIAASSTVAPTNIQIGTVADLSVSVPVIAAINEGQSADILVEVENARTGDGVNGATVEIRFPRRRGLGPYTGTTAGGRTRKASEFIQATPTLAPAGTYNFDVIVQAPGYNNPAVVNGAIVVNAPAAPGTLDMYNAQGRVGTTLVTATPLVPVRVGQRVDFELFVRTAGTSTTIDTAIVTLTSAAGTITATPRGNGRYLASFSPAAAHVGPQRFVLTARGVPRHNDATPVYLDVEVEDIPSLNVAAHGPTLFRAGMTGVIEVEITDAAGAHVNADVELFQGRDATGTLLARTRAGTSNVSGRIARTGFFYYQMIAPTAVISPVPIVFFIRVRDSHFKESSVSLFVTVEPLVPVDVALELVDGSGNALAVAGNVYQTQANEVVTLNVQVTERGSGNPVTGTVSFSPQHNLRNSSGALSSAGTHSAQFQTAVAQRYSFTLNVRPGAGYSVPTPLAPFVIQVHPPPEMHVTVNWVPEPANRYMLMNFVVLHNVTAVAIPGASIAIKDSHAQPVQITDATITNASGQLPKALRLDLNGRVPVLGGEEHRLDITVSCAGYSPRTGRIDIHFSHPRAPMGRPESRRL